MPDVKWKSGMTLDEYKVVLYRNQPSGWLGGGDSFHFRLLCVNAYPVRSAAGT